MTRHQWTPEQLDLISEAAANKAASAAIAESEARLRADRIELMKRMAQADLPWAEIARQFGVTPQAAMYATGHSKRQKRTTVKVAEPEGKE